MSEEFLYQQSISTELEESTNSRIFHATMDGKEVLEIILQVDSENVMYRSSFFLHHPNEPPFFFYEDTISMFGAGKLIDVHATPKVFISGENLKSIAVEKRGCYFDDEHHLKLFKLYSIKNCEIECFSRTAAEICGCVPSAMIRGEETKICHNFMTLNCINDFRQNFTVKACNCLQSCNDISYDYKIMSTRFSDRLCNFRKCIPII